MSSALLPSSRFLIALAVALVGTTVVACGSKTDRTDTGAADSTTALSPSTSSSAAPTVGSHDSMAPMTQGHDTMAGMTGMTNDPNHDFLRMMTDHHKGLIAMAHETIERKDQRGIMNEAKTLDHKQDQELDKMMTMLEQQYKDPYTPKITPDNRAMIDSLAPLSGTAYSRKFVENVITHHQMGIQMIDQFLPKLTDTKLKAMAETMKSDQQKDIVRLQKELQTLQG